MATDLGETLARSATYKVLSLAFLPPCAEAANLSLAIGRILEALPEGHREILGPLAREVAAARPEAAEREYTRLFRVGLAATPYETEYDPLASARKGHCLADLLGFYQAFGFTLADAQNEFPDHIAVELEFMSLLLLKTAHATAESLEEAREVSEASAAAFLGDHLSAWAGGFADRVEAATEEDFYRLAARLLRAFLQAECRHRGLPLVTTVAGPSEGSELPGCSFTSECADTRRA